MTVSRIPARAALALALALAAVACGGDDEVQLSDLVLETSPAETPDEPSEEPSPSEIEDGDDGAGVEVEEPIGEIEVWADPGRASVLRRLVPRFREATGIEVRVEDVAFDELRGRVTQAALDGTGPDVFAGNHGWTGQLATDGVIAPVDLDERSDQFLDVAVEAFGFDGATWGVPHLVEAVALYRNIELVPEPPTTFDDLAAACAAVEVEACLVLPGGGVTPDGYFGYPFLSSFGATIFAYDESTGSYDPSEVLLDSTESGQGVEFLAAQVRAGLVPDTGYDEARELFTSGRAAFWISGPWERQGLASAGRAHAVTPIPPISDLPISPLVAVEGFFLARSSDEPELARTFLLEVIATEAAMRDLYTITFRGTAWQPLAEALDDDARAFHTSAADGVPVPNVAEMAAVWEPLGDNLLDVRSLRIGSATAVERMAAEVRAEIE